MASNGVSRDIAAVPSSRASARRLLGRLIRHVAIERTQRRAVQAEPRHEANMTAMLPTPSAIAVSARRRSLPKQKSA